MTDQERALEKIVSEIEKATTGFSKSIPGIERQVYEKLIDLVRELKTSNGKIQMVSENVRLIAKVKAEIENIILNPRYKSEVKKFLGAFESVTLLQDAYFSTMVDKYSPAKVLGQVKQDAVKQAAIDLTEAGISANVTTGVQNILRRNITEGGSFASLMDDMRGFLVTTEDSPGALQRYASTITITSLNTYSATYNETISSDLGFQWRMYTGSLLETSRPWCVHMVKKKYVHVSELQTVISDNIDGVKICSGDIPCNKKTGLPSGMMEGTNASNVTQRRGGWSCGHQFGGVPDAVVPANLRAKIKTGFAPPPVKDPEPAPPASVKTTPPKPPVVPAPSPAPSTGLKPLTDSKIYSTHDKKVTEKFHEVADFADGAIDIANEFKTSLIVTKTSQLSTYNSRSKFSAETSVPISHLPKLGKHTDGCCSTDNKFMIAKLEKGDRIEFKSYDKEFSISSAKEFLALNSKFRETFSSTYGKIIVDEKGIMMAKVQDDGTVKHWGVGILDQSNKAPTVSHELGHLIHNKYDKSAFRSLSMRPKMMAIATKLNVTLNDAPTIYGQTNWSEFWSECFSAYIYSRNAFKIRFPKAYELFETTAKDYGIDLKTITQAK